MITNSKKAALEMSIGTIVTIVLVVTTMILGLVLIRSIFTTGTNAVDNIDSAIQDEINKLFADEGRKLVIYPASRTFDLQRGDDPKGFAFSVRNDDNIGDRLFTYMIQADPAFDFARCGTNFNAQIANNWIIIDSGSFTLGPSASMELPILVLFEVPDSAPSCTIPYNLEIKSLNQIYEQTSVYVTFE